MGARRVSACVSGSITWQGRNIQLLASGCWLNAIAFIGKIQKAKGVAASVKACV
jgi:hypothetical protein